MRFSVPHLAEPRIFERARVCRGKRESLQALFESKKQFTRRLLTRKAACTAHSSTYHFHRSHAPSTRIDISRASESELLYFSSRESAFWKRIPCGFLIRNSKKSNLVNWDLILSLYSARYGARSERRFVYDERQLKKSNFADTSRY